MSGGNAFNKWEVVRVLPFIRRLWRGGRKGDGPSALVTTHSLRDVPRMGDDVEVYRKNEHESYTQDWRWYLKVPTKNTDRSIHG